MSIKLKPLSEQVIVITGASSGIGLTTAEAAAKAGAKLVLAARSKQALDEIARRLGENAIAVECDVADRGQVQAVADAAVARFGRIDTWVNDAGVAIFGRLDEVSDADSRRMFETNFWGVVNGSLVALPHLRRDGGALINVGSEVSEAVVPMLGMYAATKHAVKGFTDALRIEIERVDKAPVSITLIQPTAVDTPFDEHGRNYMANEPDLPTPMIDPQQVADAILKCAVKPTRDVRVGMMSKVNTFMAKYVPGMADRMAAKQVENLKRDEPPRRDSEGALHAASEAKTTAGHTHGDHAK
ncbi:MAG TPA: SDR family oxidoreductase [Tepidisphaeraceae bacterium]|nr:SDR family oxidoreductase [Tepidisphaeraceae bacterium]